MIRGQNNVIKQLHSALAYDMSANPDLVTEFGALLNLEHGIVATNA